MSAHLSVVLEGNSPVWFLRMPHNTVDARQYTV